MRRLALAIMVLALLSVSAVDANQRFGHVVHDDGPMNHDYGIGGIEFVGYACKPTPEETSAARSPRADILGIETLHSSESFMVPGMQYVRENSVQRFAFNGAQNAHDNPRHVEGPPDGGEQGGSRPVVSLGQAGWFIGEMTYSIDNQSGDDLVVYEAARPGVPESFCVYGAYDWGGPFYYVGLHVADPNNANEAHAFDLQDDFVVFSGDERPAVRYVMVLDSADANAEVNVDFTYLPTAPQTQQDVQFTDTTTRFDARPFTSRLWTFGDGHTSISEHPVHSYDRSGTYTVCLALEDDAGTKGQACHDVVVLNQPPAAAFSVSTKSTPPVSFEQVSFTDLSTDAEDGIPIAWAWDFGDGHTSNERHPVHQFSKSGTYHVVLSVQDSNGARGIAKQELVVDNAPPMPDFDAESDVLSAGAPFGLLDRSVDVDGTIVAWAWDLHDDGSIDFSQQNPTVVFAATGDYPVRLTVTDDEGATAHITKTVAVTNEAPVADFDISGGVLTFDEFEFSSTATDSDGQVVAWRWNFGNVLKDGQAARHAYSNDGPFAVTLQVWDNAGATHSVTKHVNVENRPPLASFLATGGTATTDLQLFESRSSDPDGTVVRWHWNLGDGTTTTQVNPGHRYQATGQYLVTLTVTDDDGATATTQETVVIDNEGPVAEFAVERDGDEFTVHSRAFDADDAINVEWVLWDGSVVAGSRLDVTVPADGALYLVTMRVTDARGAQDTAEVVLRNQSPTEGGGSGGSGPLVQPDREDDEELPDAGSGAGADSPGPGADGDEPTGLRPSRESQSPPTAQEAQSMWLLLLLVPVALMASAMVVVLRHRSRK